jgi:GT2 family glycosyltransferase
MCGASILHHGTDHVVQCLGGASYNRWLGRLNELGGGQRLPARIDAATIEKQMTYVSGASMFVRQAFLDTVGPMSERYFLYCEELDWATRGRRHGFRLGYAPGAIVWHREGAALGSGKAAKRSPLAEFYGLRSRLRYTAAHLPAALPLIWLTGSAQLLKRVAGGRWRLARALARALAFRNTP